MVSRYSKLFYNIKAGDLHKSLRLPNFFVPLHIGLLAGTQLSAEGLKAMKSNGNGRRMRHLFPTTYPTKYIYLCLKTIA